MTNQLAGQAALVTGAGRGIGQAIANSLAAAGASVGVVSRNQSELDDTVNGITSSGGLAYAARADVRNPESVLAAVEAVSQHLGPVSILVNNAGAPGPVGNDWEVDADGWWECIESIVRGAFLFNRVVIPGMIARGGGRIINVASASGTRAPGMPIFASSIAKTALIRLSEELAQTARKSGIASFAIHPGIVNTKLLSSYGLAIPESTFASPERAGLLCARLASGHYDSLSGRYLTIDDDLDALTARADEIIKDELLTLRIKD
ncbi:MAG: SDR family oxidoreductase [Anaerolineaceae bacterium]